MNTRGVLGIDLELVEAGIEDLLGEVAFVTRSDKPP